MFNDKLLLLRTHPPMRIRAAVCILLLSGCGSTVESLTSVAPPTARIVATQLSGLTLDHVDLEVDIEVENPAAVPIPLLDVRYSLSSRGISLLSGRTALEGTVPATGSRVVPLEIGVDLSELVRALSGTRPGAIVPYQISLEVGVDAAVVGGIQLPVSQRGRLPIPTLPRLHVSRFRWDELSLQTVRGTMELQIGNPNAFALTLQRVDATLELAGRSVAQVELQPQRWIPAESESSVEVPIGFAPASLGASALELLDGASTSYLLDGRLSVETPFGPLEMPFVASGQAGLERE
jgi:LEA14-like dessication related protein